MEQLTQLTNAMHRLEEIIARQQRYILQHGQANDRNPDKQWEQYKADAEANLRQWDEMKRQRDSMKMATLNFSDQVSKIDIESYIYSLSYNRCREDARGNTLLYSERSAELAGFLAAVQMLTDITPEECEEAVRAGERGFQVMNQK